MIHGIILHEEYRERMKKLSSEELGDLVKNMFRVDDGIEPETFSTDYLNLLNETVCGRVARDIAKSDKQRANRLGKTKNNQTKTKKKPKKNQTITNEKPNDNQTKTPITNNQLPITNNQYINSYVEEIVNFLNEKTGKRFQSRGETERLINGRLNEGYTIDDFKKVITIKCNEWKDDPKYSRYLQPSTLFAPSHFDEYLNQPEKVTKPTLVKPNQFTEGATSKGYDFSELEKKLIKN